MEIDVICQGVSCSEEKFVKLATEVLSLLHLPQAILSVLLCDDQCIQPLNRSYRGKDRATDVLSFAQREGDFAFAEDDVLGDVIISVETAARQATEKQHPVDKEMTILLVHGILHLLGYDHIEDDEAVIMEAKEKEILDQLSRQW